MSVYVLVVKEINKKGAIHAASLFTEQMTPLSLEQWSISVAFTGAELPENGQVTGAMKPSGSWSLFMGDKTLCCVKGFVPLEKLNF